MWEFFEKLYLYFVSLSYRDLAISFSITATAFVITVILETIREHRKDKKTKDKLDDED